MRYNYHSSHSHDHKININELISALLQNCHFVKFGQSCGITSQAKFVTAFNSFFSVADKNPNELLRKQD